MDDRRPPVTLHRFFVGPDAIVQGRVVFAAEQEQQMRRVLRLRPGDEVIALDGSGAELRVRLESDFTGLVVEQGPNTAEARLHLTLYQGLVKGAKFETILQKGTEIGVARFVPVITERAVPGEPGLSRQRRFAAIVREAAEQSRRGVIPDVAPPLSFGQALEEAAQGGCPFLLWEEEASEHLMAAATGVEGPVSLFVGPEGGFTTEEAALARNRGVLPVTLGPRILRAETAAIVGSALLLAAFGDLG